MKTVKWCFGVADNGDGANDKVATDEDSASKADAGDTDVGDADADANEVMRKAEVVSQFAFRGILNFSAIR